jgi:glycosyltransferase involved in cell wall biosynthesis
MNTNKKVIWFINKDCGPIEENGTFVRTVKQAQFFQEKGYSVKVVCSNHIHNSELVHKTESGHSVEICDGVPFLFIKSPGYKSNGIKRILSYLYFSLKLYCLRSNKLSYPGIIVHTPRIPFDGFIFKFAKRIKAIYIADVVDLWPLEMEHFGMLKPNNPLLRRFYSMERDRYTKADKVVFSQEGYGSYLRDKGWLNEQGGSISLDKTIYINNGIDLQEFDGYLNTYTLEDRDLEDKNTFKVVYLGSIRLANHLDTLLDAAKHLRDYPNIRILIYGDGFERAKLEQRVTDEGISNVIFKQKWTEPQYVPYVLTRANVNLLNYAANWAPYGGSMNKMMLSFASGRPIVCNAGMKYSPIRDNNLGIDKVFNSDKEYADAILSIYNLSHEEYVAMCQRTRKVAQEFDMPVLCQKFKDFCNL